ncbi:MAG: (2Fe-2S) ferredoxin domain-containing protein [Bacteroidota bacterium]
MEKIEITICLGSSCFSRGNKNTLRVIDDFLKSNDLKKYVQFRGNHCFGLCEKGPILKINDQVLTQVDGERAVKALKAHFNID